MTCPSTMKHSPQGIPILTMEEKLEALRHCIAEQSFEDAAGHLCDLLAHVGDKIEPSTGRKFAGLRDLVDYYGKHPCLIEESR